MNRAKTTKHNALSGVRCKYGNQQMATLNGEEMRARRSRTKKGRDSGSRTSESGKIGKKRRYYNLIRHVLTELDKQLVVISAAP